MTTSNVTVKEIFDTISMLNPTVSSISSLGSYVSQSSQMVADSVYSEVIKYLPNTSLAYSILTNPKANSFSQKQLWVIAYELVKSAEYCNALGQVLAQRKATAKAKSDSSKTKLQENKSATQDVLDFVKSNGKKLGDYYTFLKKNKAFAKEFFSKKFTMESANTFLAQ